MVASWSATTRSASQLSGWAASDVADFNGDGRVDILWRNANHEISIWLATANGGFTASTTLVPADVFIQQVGDFNGDGRDDILWRGNNNDVVGTWLASPTGEFEVNSRAAVGSVAGWRELEAGDFNGDGRDDILWMNATRHVSIWLATGDGNFSVDSASGINQAAFGWHVGAIGDYNGDGRDDVLWHYQTGLLSVWLETPTGAFTVDSVGARVSPNDWYIV